MISIVQMYNEYQQLSISELFDKGQQYNKKEICS